MITLLEGIVVSLLILSFLLGNARGRDVISQSKFLVLLGGICSAVIGIFLFIPPTILGSYNSTTPLIVPAIILLCSLISGASAYMTALVCWFASRRGKD